MPTNKDEKARQVQRLAKDKRTSLLRNFVNYGQKLFYSIGPWRLPRFRQTFKIVVGVLADFGIRQFRADFREKRVRRQELRRLRVLRLLLPPAEVQAGDGGPPAGHPPVGLLLVRQEDVGLVVVSGNVLRPEFKNVRIQTMHNLNTLTPYMY